MTRTTPPLPDDHPLNDLIEDFALAQAADGLSARTIAMRTDAVRWLASHLVSDEEERTSLILWSDVTRADLRRFMASLSSYSPGYRNNVFRCLRPFFEFLTAEMGYVSPMAGMKPPSIPERILPVVSASDTRAMLAVKGRKFQSIRDTAIIMLFMSSGMRRAELHGLQVGHIDIQQRTAVVKGKGSKLRVIRFDPPTAIALARYLRARKRFIQSRKDLDVASIDAMWIGACGPLKLNAINQLLRMRAKRAGIAHVSPHSFRRAFSVEFLMRGGNESDLMTLNGWQSPEMVRHYTRSAQAERALIAYDRVMGR